MVAAVKRGRGGEKEKKERKRKRKEKKTKANDANEGPWCATFIKGDLESNGIVLSRFKLLTQ